MPFSRSGPLRGLDAYCKDDELSEIGSQLAEGSINAGRVKPWRTSAFVLLVLAKVRPWLSRGLGPSGVHLSLDELRMNDGGRVACWDYFVLPQGAECSDPILAQTATAPRIEDEVRLGRHFRRSPSCAERPTRYLRPLHRRHSGRASSCKNLLPEMTPVYLTFTMALELATAASHSSSTFRADPVQNAGDHFCTRFEPAQSDKCHLSPQPSHRALSIDRA
jgi:hypothetical protein